MNMNRPWQCQSSKTHIERTAGDNNGRQATEKRKIENAYEHQSVLISTCVRKCCRSMLKSSFPGDRTGSCIEQRPDRWAASASFQTARSLRNIWDRSRGLRVD